MELAKADPRDDRIHLEDVGHKRCSLLPAGAREPGTAKHAAPLQDTLEALLHELAGEQEGSHCLVRLKLPPTAAIDLPPPFPSRSIIPAQNAGRSDIRIPLK